MVHNQITDIIDFFYLPFKKWLPLQTFRYAACGGANTVLGLVLYTVSYKYIFKEQIFYFSNFALTPHIAALFFAFLFNFPLGMFLMKYVVFVDSSLRGRVQLFRYFVVFLLNLFLNYLLLKLMRDTWRWNAILAQVIATAVVITTSYILQRHYSFKAAGVTRTE